MVKEKNGTPAQEEWRRLFEAAVQVKQLGPWNWMYEDEIFGLQNPETGELGFVSIMGAAGEHFAVSIYRGAEGLYDFFDLQISEDGEGLADPLALFDIAQLQASFENREQLEKQDRDIIKQLGLKFRGANQWPMFRSILPGFLPWHITSGEARFLTYALEQTLEVTPRLRENPELFNVGPEDYFLMRTAREEGGQLIWFDRARRIPPPSVEDIKVPFDNSQVGPLKALPQKKMTVEVALIRMPTPIAERGQRPYFPQLLLFADAKSSLILGFEMLRPERTPLATQSLIPSRVAGWMLQSAQSRPWQIKVGTELLGELLAPLCQPLNIKLKQVENLPAIDAAVEGMFGMMFGASKSEDGFFGGEPLL